MCFSASASALAAFVTGGAGAATLVRCAKPREVPLASLPLLFSFQQAMEAALWLYLPQGAGRPLAQFLANGFSLIALAVWPLLVPIAFGLLEPRRRRLLYGALLVAGGIAALYALAELARLPVKATLAAESICYVIAPYSRWAAAAYVISTYVPPLVSSHPLLRLFGVAVTAGVVVSYASYILAFVSVWCFFAALGSILLVGFFHARVSAFRAAPTGA